MIVRNKIDTHHFFVGPRILTRVFVDADLPAPAVRRSPDRDCRAALTLLTIQYIKRWFVCKVNNDVVRSLVGDGSVTWFSIQFQSH